MLISHIDLFISFLTIFQTSDISTIFNRNHLLNISYGIGDKYAFNSMLVCLLLEIASDREKVWKIDRKWLRNNRYIHTHTHTCTPANCENVIAQWTWSIFFSVDLVLLHKIIRRYVIVLQSFIKSISKKFYTIVLPRL